MGDKQVWWKAGEVNIRTTQPSVTGYVGIRQDPPRPTATVEQMRAAADKAMMIEDNTYLCAGCGQKTLTDGEKPLGWHFNAEVHGGVYRALCGTCFAQGPFDEWECDSCGKTSFPMRSMPTGWMEQQVRRGDDDIVMETVCDECNGFGHKHGPDRQQEYVCGWCNSTTESMVFPPPGWKATDDNEVICFACAEEEAKP